MKKRPQRGMWYLYLLGLVAFTAPNPLLAGRFVVTSVSTPVLAETATGLEFAVHATARWEGNLSTNGFNRLIRTFWWVSGEGWCDNSLPGMLCPNDGRVYPAPFFPGDTITCTSFNGCAANKAVTKKCCDTNWTFYSGKGDVVNLHGGTSVDHQKDGSVKPVPCRECPGPEPGPEPDIPCHDPTPQLHVEPVAGRLPGDGEAVFGNFPLERVEHLRGMHYVMEEWAILVVERDAAGALLSIEVPAASSSAYADHQRQSLVQSFTPDGGPSPLPQADGTERSVLLVVHHPNHPHNERWIPTPQAHLGAGTLSGEAAEGRAVVRADFSEDRTLSALDVLWSDRPVMEEELAFLESNLTLVYGNDDEHRVVLYGVVQLGGKTIDLENYMPVPSMCCCPSDWPDCSVSGPEI